LFLGLCSWVSLKGGEVHAPVIFFRLDLWQASVVHLNRNLGEPQAVELLCHEYTHALAWNYSLDRLARSPGIDPAEFDRASHDEAWGCAYSRVWRAYQEVIREAA
jgi:hypothetical protein